MAEKVSANVAIEKIQSGMRVFVHGGTMTPISLIQELVAQHSRLQDVTLVHLHTHGTASYAEPKYHRHFKVMNLFVGANVRPYVDFDAIDYVPCFLSEMPGLFRSGKISLDVAIVQVSRPDKHGYCSLGLGVDVAKAAVESAKIVIAQVNPNVPRTFGDALIPVDSIDFLVEKEEPLAVTTLKPPQEAEQKIARLAASLVEDGATLQTGIGSIPDAILAQLKNHKNLGIHSEMWSDGALDLIQSGAINNRLKKTHRGKSVSTFIMGTQRVLDFVNDNPSVILMEADYVNNPTVIAKNENVTAINSAVEIDLTGQVCADSIGHRIISGVGGQIDFLRGAALSKGGKPIIAFTSRTSKGKSRIVSTLNAGAGVVTTRAHVHYIVTEYGVANLHGKTIRQRSRALIDIAHPDDREKLERSFTEEYLRR
ncbi:MAG: acetyl-CoA hydrolase/transferase family protein [Bdellovibrionaceae bacterium]|nr:acetyl-CoA hydrolase/transferase family protein [Pseudobdellovibrionaceae bacterium]